MFMIMLLALMLLGTGALLSPVLHRRWLGPIFTIASSALTVFCALYTIISGNGWDIVLPWQMPMASFHIGMDALSAVFVLLISGIGALAAVYGRGYLSHEDHLKKVGVSWCWFNLLVASMLLVVIARDGFLFLMAWEAMSLTSFFLVMFEHEKPGVMKAGWIYLATTHIGTAFLLVMFIMMGNGHSLDFSAMQFSNELSSLVFIGALIGFGTKAGFVPLHIWLPEAHPAAPSHVSALMSGVMIKLGIYGLLRTILLVGGVEEWWGWAFIIIGALSGVLGVLFALAQHDLKRLLAYHSVENIGIIAMGIGIGILGITSGNTAMAALGFCGGLLHVINHGVFKSLLFMGAGAVIRASGTREIDRMGGLIKKMPVTGASFLVGAAAISALPPLNGFVSEFLVYSSAIKGLSAGTGIWSALLLISSLALIGGLAAACFTKAFGVVFTGEARSGDVAGAVEAPRSMLMPMITLAAICIILGIGAPSAIRIVVPAVAQFVPQAGKSGALSEMTQISGWVGLCAAMLAIFIITFVRLRARILKKRKIRETVTWDCGYAAPTARMQYTASSFADPLVGMFSSVLQSKREIQEPKNYFPDAASLHTHTDDVFVRFIYSPGLQLFKRLAGTFRTLQRGRTHLYILYIFVTIIALLIWNLR